MNKFKHILVAVAVSMGLFSCSDSYLDTESKTNLTDGSFYKTVADMEMALIGCYDGYQRTTSDGGVAHYVTSELLSDNCFGGTGNTDGRAYQALDRFDITQSPSDNNIFNQTWISYYAGIFRCNTLLTKMETSDWSDQAATVNRIAGEARFIRALLYFDLVRLFERVPLLTAPTTDNVPQADPTDTYKLIVEDLKFAAANIPADAYPKAKASENDGRVTSFAAKALLARVYLFYTGYYAKDDLGVTKAEVLAGLEDIVDSGEFDLLPTYKEMWPAASYIPNADDNKLDKSGYAGAGNVEVIFAEKFNNTSDYNGMVDGNRWLVMLGMRNTNWSPYGKGWGACTVNPKLVNAFAANDQRKTASIIDIAKEGIEAKYDKKDQREYTGYSNKKYTPTALPDGTSDTGGDNDFQISQDQDYVIIRYADVLLMAAELGSNNAQNYYDQVRKRAGLTTKTVSQANILEERRFEFAFEGLRYWDLLRQGLDVAASTIAQSQKVLSGNAEDEVVITAENIKKTRGFMQIPNTQITLSKNVLTQNAGW
ncbi:MAG: RagB/SusD family nutrient uptake outer membrane protein [Dysgonomonas mossii]|uniref:RagB/SusD family nutrient uptake outer membrane protein n=1 Tax=Dysgonomonas mossii TaxID=163665 RepID=UPI001D3FF5CB|nr:RagB/SusD family nutrient uptake outer membrane protein [Dysgonomonas mossii]MBS5795803.1 RagB/SusD family nutrient uptake outer membrane protein [Dysgonomonas mossii]MBS7111263.1 RagB/SusD family nutrient uptake outer membrane protein [Dysgonomonas mossii]